MYALAHVRGGGEYGQPWIAAGSGVHKQNGIDDFVAAGEWLIANGYTSRARLVANGNSAGGPLAAAAVNQRPELFGAAVIDYPFSDLLRTGRFTVGNSTTFGDPAHEADFRALRAWSPITTSGQASAILRR